ncbi:MAG TPA: helix-turn-helix domain-containing protein, partial [Ktedonobacteraceae bacterium]
ELLTVSEVARRLRVDTTTVRRWVKRGALQAITLPHTGGRQVYRIHKSTLDDLLTNTTLQQRLLDAETTLANPHRSS